MYQLSLRNKSPWGVDGYNIPADYIDVAKIIKEREGKENRRSHKLSSSLQLKKGHFFDSIIRTARGVPGTGTYELQTSFVKQEERPGHARSKSSKISRGTYVDKIFANAEKNPSPGRVNIPLTYKKYSFPFWGNILYIVTFLAAFK